MIDIRLHTFVRTHQIINWWIFITWKLYLNKVDLKKSYTLIHNVCDPISPICNMFLRKILLETINLYFSQFIIKLSIHFLKGDYIYSTSPSQEMGGWDRGGEAKQTIFMAAQASPFMCGVTSPCLPGILVLPREILLVEV